MSVHDPRLSECASRIIVAHLVGGYWPVPATRNPKTGTYLEGMSEEHDYKEYKIQITEYADGWQAAIYPTKRGLPIIDWESKPIWSPNIMGALTLAKRHIDSTLAGS
jgi:hypothetical protein